MNKEQIRKGLLFLLLLVVPVCAHGKMDFDDNYNQYIDCGNVHPNEMTVVYWFNGVNGQASIGGVGTYNNGVDGYFCGPDDGDRLRFSINGLTGTGDLLVGGLSLSGAVHHLACVYKPGDYMKMYLDGNEIGEDTSVDASQSHSNSFKIANRGDGGSDYMFDGFIHDVRVYERALSAEEIWTLRNSRSRVLITEDILGGWRLDERDPPQDCSGVADGVIDWTGNGYHGQCINASSSGPEYAGDDILRYP